MKLIIIKDNLYLILEEINFISAVVRISIN